jgi:hypothetical protein
MQSKREFEPLMASIERTLAALDNRADTAGLDAAAEELRALYDTYFECCCRRAHVVKEEEYSAS